MIIPNYYLYKDLINLTQVSRGFSLIILLFLIYRGGFRFEPENYFSNKKCEKIRFVRNFSH